MWPIEVHPTPPTRLETTPQMSRAQTRQKIKLLKQQLKAENRAAEARLLRLILLLVIAAAIAVLAYGRMTL